MLQLFDTEMMYISNSNLKPLIIKSTVSEITYKTTEARDNEKEEVCTSRKFSLLLNNNVGKRKKDGKCEG